MRARAGMTMLELIVVVAIMTVMAGVVGLAVAQSEPPARPDSLNAAQAAVADARRTAIRNRAPVSITVSVMAADLAPAAGSSARISLDAIAFPDGSVIADHALGIDRLTGRPHRVRRASRR